MLSLSVQDTMADDGQRRPERRGANGRGASECGSRESERESREIERDVVGRGRSVSGDPTASVLSKRRRQRVRYAMSRILGPTCRKRPQPSQMTCSVQSAKLLLNPRWLLQMISDHVVFCKISPKCGGF